MNPYKIGSTYDLPPGNIGIKEFGKTSSAFPKERKKPTLIN